jgi:Ran GTPase-activating protein (RanGAP) involved in mRNA processing and transport
MQLRHSTYRRFRKADSSPFAAAHKEVSTALVMKRMRGGARVQMVNPANASHKLRFLQNAPECIRMGQITLSAQALGVHATKVIVEMIRCLPQAWKHPALQELSVFHSLDLSNNALHDAGAVVIAGLLCADVQLKYLNLAGNSTGPPGMKALFNALADFNTTLTHLDVSTEVSRGKMHLGKQGALALRVCLEKNQTLSTLCLAGVNLGLGGNVEAIQQISQGLLVNRNLLTLDLNRNHLEYAHLCCLVQAFKSQQQSKQSSTRVQLQVLLLSGNKLGSAGIAQLVQLLPYLPELRVLDVSHNDIDINGLTLLIHAVGVVVPVDHDAADMTGDSATTSSNAWKPISKVSRLILDHNPLGATKVIFTTSKKSKKKGSNQATLHWSEVIRRELDSRNLSVSTFVFPSRFRVSMNLHHLSMTQCGLSDSIVEELVRCLVTELARTQLNMGNVSLPVPAAEQEVSSTDAKRPIRGSLYMSVTCLSTLRLENNNLQNRAATALARLLSCDHSLTILNLNMNRIQAEGGNAIFQALLQHNDSLRVLLFSNNMLDESTGRLCMRTLMSKVSLTKVTLIGNKISFDLHGAIDTIVKKCATSFHDSEMSRLEEERRELYQVRARKVAVHSNCLLLQTYCDLCRRKYDVILAQLELEMNAKADDMENLVVRLQGLEAQRIDIEIYTTELHDTSARVLREADKTYKQLRQAITTERDLINQLGMEKVLTIKNAKDNMSKARKKVADLQKQLQREAEEVHELKMGVQSSRADLEQFVSSLLTQTEGSRIALGQRTQHQ